MKQTKVTTFFFILILLLSTCSTGNKSFKKGEYYNATIKAVKNLRSNPDSKKSKELISQSYPMAIDYYRQKIDQYSISNSEDKYYEIVNIYQKLNTLADEISRCPAALNIVKPVTYFNKQLDKALNLATEEQVHVAQNMLESGYYMDARMALKRLEWVHEQKSTYPNLEEMLTTAHNLSILKTVVEMQPELRTSHAINSQVFYYRMYDYLTSKAGTEFTRFYNPSTAEDLKIHPHQILKFQFIDFKTGQLVDRQKEREYESDSISIGTYTAENGREHNVYGTVQAEVTTYEREILATGILQVSIVDYATGEIIKTKKFPGEYFWKNHFATFNGDKRALPDYIIDMTQKKQQVPPSPQEMFLLLSDPIFNNTSYYLKSYYKKH